MNILFLAAQGAAKGGQSSFLIMMVVIFVIMWFFMIRPQQKRQKETRNFQNSLAEGTKVIIGGGIYGVVKHIDLTTNKIDVEVSKGVVLTVDKASVFADLASQTENKA